MAIVQLPIVCPGLESGIRVRKGTDKVIPFSTGLDLSGGATITLIVKRGPTAIDVLLMKNATIPFPGSDGNAEFDFVANDYAGIPAGLYIFNITITSPSLGTQELTSGQFIIDPFDQSLIGRLEPIMTLSITGSTERVGLELRDRDGVLANPIDLNLQILDDSDNQIVNVNFPDPSIRNPQAGIFSFDLTSDRVGDHLALWTFRFPDEESTKVIKNLRFVTPAMFRMMGEVRLFIDKARKSSEKPIAFNPPDVAEYIEMSLREFNAWPPTTQLHLEEINEVYKAIIVEGAIIWSLVAQGLLAIDQDFQYNDNGIALSVDHHSKLQSWRQALLQDYVAKKKAYKFNFFQPFVYSRTIVGQAFSLGLAKVPAGTLSRFRGWI